MKQPDSKYHQWLKSILDNFSNENKDKLTKCNSSIKLTSGKHHRKNMTEYNPDYIFTFKTGKKSFEYIIFEFLDTQSYEGIISDIIECACIKNCRILLFLSKDTEKHKQAINYRNIVCDFLDEIKGENVLDVVNLHIPDSMNAEEVKDIIYKEIDKRVKLPKQPFMLGKSRLGGRAVLS